MTASGQPQLVIDTDVMIPTRDGSAVCADFILHPGPSRSPAIVCMSPYGKDVSWLDAYPDHHLDISPYTVWETPDPAWWVPRGYAIVRVDSRGIGKSPGTLDPLSAKDTEDYYDAIEYVASQPWCTGKVGLLGISFYAITQWKVAALQPPHLAAIIPWEGANDLYREWARQGGIYANGFVDFWWQLHFIDQPMLTGPAVDWREEFQRHELDDEWFRERRAELEAITVPVLSAGNWGAFHMHLRGNVEGFAQISSRHKRLIMMTGTHIDPFYTDWARLEQLRFFDRWLKDISNGAERDPPLRLAIRYGAEIEWRDEQEWPLADTEWTRLYLDVQDESLSSEAAVEGSVSYEAPAGSASFQTAAVDALLELTGPVLLRLWVSSSTEDMDVFATLRDIGPDGEEVHGIGPRGGPVPMAIGWLRASHRELDSERSLPYRPFHAHQRRLPLAPDKPTLVEIEIWPTSIVLMPGHRLRLVISGNDAHMVALVHNSSVDRPAERFAGINTLHTGGEYDSYLLAPVIPVAARQRGAVARVASMPEREVVAEANSGRVHTVFSDGAWALELEGYGEIIRFATREEAIVGGRERAQRTATEHVIHNQDGTVAGRHSYRRGHTSDPTDETARLAPRDTV